MPDINKLLAIAKIFDVTTDWLLAEEVDEEVKTESVTTTNYYPSWLDKLPSNMLNMVKKFGWIYGLYLAFGGVVTMGFGFLSRYIFKMMILGDVNSVINNAFTGDIHHQDMHHIMEGIVMDPQYGFFSSFELTAWKIASTFTGIIIGIGIATIVVGIVLAIVLKLWGKKEVTHL